MTKKGAAFTLFALVLCIDLSQALLEKKKIDLVCPVVSDEFTNYPDPNNCSNYFECHYGEPVVYSCAPGFLFDPVEQKCDFASDVDCNGTRHTTVSPVKTTPSSDFRCPTISDEFTLYADPKDCSKYYECHQGQKISLSCAPGFLFDPVEEHCNFASDVNCNGTHISTTPDPLKPTSSPGFICPAVSDEYSNYPDPKDCSKYYECHQGVPVSYTCAPGFLFDPVEGHCNFASDVDCNGKRISTTPDPLKPTSSPGFICPAVSDEYINYPDPKDCSKYYECHHGVPVSYSCAPGFLFDPVEGRCDFASDVDCKSTYSTSQPTTPEPWTTPIEPSSTETPDITEIIKTSDTTEPTDNICKNKPAGTYLADPNDCRKFYQCDNGKAITLHCPPGTIWVEGDLSCESKNIEC